MTQCAVFICLQKMACFFSSSSAFLSIRRYITITSWHRDKGHKSHVVEQGESGKFWTSRQGSRTQHPGQRFHRINFSKWLRNSWSLELVQAANEFWKVLAVFLIFLISEVCMCWEKFVFPEVHAQGLWEWFSNSGHWILVWKLHTVAPAASC